MLNKQNKRFKKHTTGSFFGSFLYDQIIPRDHFLVKARAIIDWDRFTDRCLRWYQKSDQGRPPYEPSVLLRILFLSYLYDISERQIEERVNLDLSFKYFVGLGVDEVPPDHSTLTYFKDRLLKGGGKTAFDELLREILAQAKEKGVEFGAIQIVDATHTKADVNTQKEKQKKKDDDKKDGGSFTPRDPDSSWGAKHQRKVKDPKSGKTFKQTEYFYGYKAHTSVNASSKLITSIKTTPGNLDDGSQLKTLIEKDNFTPIPKKRTYTGDRGYDYGENHEILKQKKMPDALKLNRYRTEKKNPNKEPWLKLLENKQYKEGLKERYKVEQIFGEQKQGHGLARARYLGGKKYHLQACLTGIVHNLKIVVAEITGTTLKGYRYRGGSLGLET